MKNALKSKWSIIAIPLGVLTIISDFDGSINFLNRISNASINWNLVIEIIRTSLSVFIMVAVTFLLYKHFDKDAIDKEAKNSNVYDDDIDMMKTVLSFYRTKDLGNTRYPNGNNRDMELLSYLHKEMNRKWGDLKKDSQIAELVNRFYHDLD